MIRRNPLLALLLLFAVFITACSASDLTASDTTATTDGTTSEGTAPTADDPVDTDSADTDTPDTNAPGTFTPQALRAIAEQSLESTSGRADMQMSIVASGIPDMPNGMDLSLGVYGEWDAAGNQRSTLDMSAMADMMDDLLESSGEEVPDEMGGMFDAFREPIEVRIVDGQTYMTSNFFNSFLAFLPLGEPIPTPWMSIDPEVYGSADAGDMFGSDPEMARQFIQFLRGAGEVEDLGKVELRGAMVNHLRVHITLADLLASAEDAAERAELEELWAELDGGDFGLGSMGDVPFTIDVFIDDDATLHRMSLFLDMNDIAAATGEADGLPPGAEMTMTFLVDFYDFGADIVVDAPPADQVTDATEMFENFGSMGF